MSTVRILASCHFFGNVGNFNAIYTVIQSLIQNEGISLCSEIIFILVKNHPCMYSWMNSLFMSYVFMIVTYILSCQKSFFEFYYVI